MVNCANELGFIFLGKFGNILSIKRKLLLGGKEQNLIYKYKILKIFPFKSERQRSSIIGKDLKNNIIKFYIKGSDTKIFESINEYSKKNILEITKKHVNNFARRGLRTLCYSFKKISEKEYNSWLLKYSEIK